MAAKLSARVSGTTGTKCCCDPAIITECRKRAGTATIVGWSELAGPTTPDASVDYTSSPPKKYTRRTFSGSTECVTILYGSVLATDVHAYSGYDQYNPTDGTSVSTGQITSTTTAAVIGYPYPPGEPAPNTKTTSSTGALISSPIAPFAYLAYHYSASAGRYSVDFATNATTQTASMGMVSTGNAVTQSASGTITMTMDMEDTEDAAEVRSTATWGEWYLRGGTGCGTNDCCTAKRQLRTTGFSFTFQEAEFRLGIEEGAAGTGYTVAVDIIRKLTSGSTWSLVETQYFSVTSTEPGASHDGWGTYSVAQQRGYDVTIDNIRIYHAP